MRYLKLFENWYDNRNIPDRIEYDQINIDWSKFLIDLDYTFEIVKKINPGLETHNV